MIKGKSVIDEKTVKEVVIPICARVRKVYILLAVFSTVVLAAIFLIMGRDEMAGTRIMMAIIGVIAAAIFFAVCLSMPKRIHRNTEKVLMDRLKTMQHTDRVEREIGIDENHIWLISEKFENEDAVKSEGFDINISDVVSLAETENQLLFTIKGNVYLWIDKNSLQGGSIEDIKKIAAVK